ncbi:MAG: Wzz/FepE/Etk N-terminal domain-containing protein [Silvibacterium sp.]
MVDLQAHPPGVNHTNDVENRDKIDLLDVLVLFAENKRRILATTLLGLIAGLAIALFLRPTFTAMAVILPPHQESSSASALMGEIGSLADLASSGSGSGMGIKNPADMYVGLLESRTIADSLIKKFHLQEVYGTKTDVQTRAVLKKKATIAAEKDGLISVTVKDHDPNRASDLANGYVSGLYLMNSHLAITEAAQRRVFFEQQLNQEKIALANAETAFKNTQEKTGLIQLSGQAESIIRTIAGLNAEITSREVELQAMKTFATDQNPDLIRTQQEVDELHGQLAKLEAAQSKEQPGNVQIPTGKVPQAALEYSEKLRDLKFHETLYELLTRQYESARIDEAKSAPLIQVVDNAVPPEKKSGPSRILITLGGILAGFLFGVFWSLSVRAVYKMRSTPDKAIKLTRIRLALRK